MSAGARARYLKKRSSTHTWSGLPRLNSWIVGKPETVSGMQPRIGKKRISPVRAISSDKSNAAPLDQQSLILLVPLVFPSILLNGKQPRVANMLVEDHLRPAAVKAGILSSHPDNNGGLVDDDPRRFGFHNLRHSLASFLIRIRTDPKTVQTLLRHSDVKLTLQFYTHAVSRDRMTAAGEMLTAILSHAPDKNGLRAD